MTNPIDILKDQLDAAGHWQKEFKLKRNEHLKTGGSTDTNIYYVKSGSLRVYIMDENNEHTIRFGYRGSFITALDSYISGQPSEFFIQAIKQTELKMIGKEAFRQFIEESPVNMTIWTDLLQQLIYQQLEREKDLLTTSPENRYKRVLQRSPQLFQEIPHKYIASYLRMTPETLSRIKKS